MLTLWLDMAVFEGFGTFKETIFIFFFLSSDFKMYLICFLFLFLLTP